MQKRRTFRVAFGVHVRRHLIDTWRGGLAYCGDVAQGANDREFLVTVGRDAMSERLTQMLVLWERDGVVRWDDVTDTPHAP